MSAIPATDLCCKGCGDRMPGINNYKLRTLCEPCGGNTTEFSVLNPNPEGQTAKTMAARLG